MFTAQQRAEMTEVISKFFLPWLKANGIEATPVIGIEASFDNTPAGGEAPFEITFSREGKSNLGLDGAEVYRQIKLGKAAQLNGDFNSIQDYYFGQHSEPKVTFAAMFFPDPPAPARPKLVGDEVHVNNPNLDATRRYFASNGSDGEMVINRAGVSCHLAENVEVIQDGHAYRYVAAGPFTRLFMLLE